MAVPIGGAWVAYEGKRKNEEKKLGWKKSTVLYLHDLAYMLVIIMILFSLVFRVNVVSGSSMYQTLVDGDYLLLLSNVFYREPEQGDIVVVSKHSFDNGAPIVKRVIATEGQIVDMDFVNGIVYVDGLPLEEDYTYTPTNVDEGMLFPLIVEENCIFVMGDNRNGSKDSRNPEIGLIDTREVLGKAILLIFPGDHKGQEPRNFERMGAIG